MTTPRRPARHSLAPRSLALAATGLLALAVLVWAFWPEPVTVDLARVSRAPMEVTVSAEGVTRVRDRYEVTAPLAGTVLRAPVAVGDAVRAGETVVARIQPLEPAFLDTRARAGAEAAVAEAQAALALARARLAQARADLDQAESDYARNETLAALGRVSQHLLEEATTTRAVARSALEAAQSSVDLQQASLARAQAALLGPGEDGAGSACCIDLRAPASGSVLELANESARPVQAGDVLMTLGDLGDLEIEVDLLSSDAVQVPPGASAHVERWGGAEALAARVRQIEPAAFTKVSALGIEEQRVHLKLDLLTPPEARPGLGDQYRVYVRVVIWQAPAVLQVPIGALFRDGAGWAVFVVESGRARLRAVTIGHQTDLAAEITAGLTEGAQVIAFPGARIAEGSRVTAPPGG